MWVGGAITAALSICRLANNVPRPAAVFACQTNLGVHPRQGFQELLETDSPFKLFVSHDDCADIVV